MYTTSSIFLNTLSQCGITHAFVNWGSDHPALLEELERQRIASGKTDLQIITCPNEMVALSAAQGFAQASGRPAAVFVHVDVGTQALAGAIHNVDRCRVPVLIYAGASPFTLEGELKGSRNEWIMFLQDVHDQSAVVRQYMRWTCQINSGRNVSQVVRRGLQLAMSEPKGPVYLWARREAMEEEFSENFAKTAIDVRTWSPIEPSALSQSAARSIAQSLMNAEKPLIITSYLGRNPKAIVKLIELSERTAIPVLVSCPSMVNFPHSHPHFVELSFGMGVSDWLRSADVILIIDSDIPYIPMHNKPRSDAKVFHVDVDVLKDNMGMFHIDAQMRCKADAQLALAQILEHIPSDMASNDSRVSTRAQELKYLSLERQASLDSAESTLPADGSFTVPNLMRALRNSIPVPDRTLILNEGISNYPFVWNHLRPERPGSMFTSGSSSLGWGLGASIGASLALNGGSSNDLDLVVLVVGDGSFLFGVPASAFWIARRYSTPFLTIILNNGGWRSPKLSMMGVYPQGHGSKVSGNQLTVGFGPETPDYSQIAVAAGGAWGKRITQASEMETAMAEAVNVVRTEKRCAVLDCVIESI
ncbi:Thiamin diphosphate-binding protein [Fomitiporia mediterranea MF3/22]|uniref:Thiamin diphosphate-binding protein n=1 Tax=Fomitiporia mediterranea (strain MF3/22) TaxID=694068 RepID=UPI0004407B88|nr:Thiamin diphosphate-binding protein [Fomitiporia mediterranea MF3/22]EJD04839.1 Thiamin diphosphate-binding protein [Fomitiporia mediterranea MF3/22]